MMLCLECISFVSKNAAKGSVGKKNLKIYVGFYFQSIWPKTWSFFDRLHFVWRTESFKKVMEAFFLKKKSGFVVQWFLGSTWTKKEAKKVIFSLLFVQYYMCFYCKKCSLLKLRNKILNYKNFCCSQIWVHYTHLIYFW